MSSKVKFERICEYCGKVFLAQTCITRFCSHACNNSNYREMIRSGRYNSVTKEVKEEKKQRIKLSVDEVEFIQSKEFISLKQIGIYLGICRKSVYTYLRKYSIPFSRIGGRIIVERKEIDKIMNTLIQSIEAKQESPVKVLEHLTDFYTVKEIEEKYHIKYNRLYVIVKEYNIPFVTIAGHKYYSVKHIDKYFLKMGYAEAEEITEWYTIEDIQKIFNMTKHAVHSFTHRHKIPKKKEKTGNTTLYSKKHVDEIKNTHFGEAGYITIPEACSMFNVDRDTIYNRCLSYKIPKIKKGKFVIVSVEGLRKVFGAGNVAIKNVNMALENNNDEITNSDK